MCVTKPNIFTLIPCTKFILGNIKYIYIYIFYYYHLSSLRCHRHLKSSLLENCDPFILWSQYHGYWLSGDARSHGINSKAINLVWRDFSGSSTRNFQRLLWFPCPLKQLPLLIPDHVFLQNNIIFDPVIVEGNTSDQLIVSSVGTVWFPFTPDSKVHGAYMGPPGGGR